jgi:beta-lysine 5,6-aminomutase alpha subunit
MRRNNMESKLNLNWSLVEKARNSAKNIAKDTQVFIDLHTTVTVERTVCRLLGIDGVDEVGVPIPNIVVENIKNGNGLALGAAMFIGNAMLETGLSPQEVSEKVAKGEMDLTKLPMHDAFEIKLAIDKVAKAMVTKISENRGKREAYLEEFGDKSGPYLYAIVATGNIYEDIIQAKAAAKQGADIIAVIRTTGQSLLDFVPYGATTEGFGGTVASQENFRLMRAALDEASVELGRYIRLCNYCSGLCMPEIAAMGAIERLDVMLNDALYGILFRDINMQRTIVDQYFSRIINGFAGVIINTGEDNYLTTADAVEEAHTVLASQFINEQFALVAGIPEEQMGLGHAFEISPDVENGFLFELAQAQMAREIFPKAPLKYMPPTKFKTGDIFKGQVQDTLFNMVTIMTGQKLHLLGMITEAIHTPFMADRAISIDNAKYVFSTMKDLGSEITFKSGGIMETRVDEVLNKATDLIQEIEKEGLFSTLEQGKFAGIKRPLTGGKGLAGVVQKEKAYFNPFVDLMLGGTTIDNCCVQNEHARGKK